MLSHYASGASILLAGALASGPMPATAATATTKAINASIPVTMNIQATCTLSTTSMAFGTFTGLDKDATATLTVTCTDTTTYEVGADNGQHSAYIGVYAKYMTGPSTTDLRYHLYTDAARSIEWGSTSGSNEFTGTGTGLAQVITVYGTIKSNFKAVSGNYADTVTLTITF